MIFEMKMPDLATTGGEIRVIRWIAKPGDPVKRGQPLLEVETDKATTEVPSIVDGVLKTIDAPDGTMVVAGLLIATFEVAGTAPTPSPAPPSKPGGMFARNRAAAAAGGVHVQTPKPAGIALSPAHLTAAKRLQQSKQTVPHFYLQSSFNAKSIIALREERTIAWDAFFVLAVARALKRFDRMAMRFETDRLLPPPCDAVGVAVDAKGELFVIAVNEPSTKSLDAISDDIRAQAERVRAGDASARRLPKVAMTITNLGSCNVESFIPIINPPESAILGIGRVMPTCVARDTRIAIEQRATLTLVVDHRVVSGMYAGDFLGEIVTELELFDIP